MIIIFFCVIISGVNIFLRHKMFFNSQLVHINDALAHDVVTGSLTVEKLKQYLAKGADINYVSRGN